ncbi:MAG: sulfotransferase domain-containing protein [Candidatus Babeliales bacterium]|nr:sulfotransferase domain-containing protein [Candidatus Babeliales bacterium]
MKLIIFLLLFCQSIICSDSIFVTSIPKGGTHLLVKCLDMITKKTPRLFNYPHQKYIDELDPNSFNYFATHTPYSAEYFQLIKSKKFKIFFIYRDPRDQIVSFASYIPKYPKVWPNLVSYSVKELISRLINYLPDSYDFIYKYNAGQQKSSSFNVASFYKLYLPWMQFKEVCCVKFEDLIGMQGGGSNEKQEKLVKEISNHINVKLTNEEIKNIISNLWGKSMTFRKGVIGEWKDSFTHVDKQNFKQIAGQLLIDLGYEKDLNW